MILGGYIIMTSKGTAFHNWSGNVAVYERKADANNSARRLNETQAGTPTYLKIGPFTVAAVKLEILPTS